MRNSGFTIIELMIASAILAIVMVFTMETFTVNNRTYVKIDSVVDTQQSVRAVASVLERDLRHAGMMVPEGAAVCGIDNDDAPDLLYISDYTATNPDNAIGFFDGARIQGVVSDVTGTTWLTLDTLVIEPGTPDPSYDTFGNGVNDSDFNDDGGGVIIVDLMNLNRGSVCGIVKAVDLATDKIQVEIKTGKLDGTPANYALTAVPALEYRVNSATLYRNDLRLADGIEDLQIVYFLDMNGNNTVQAGELRGDDNTDYLATDSDASFLRWVRLNIVARTRAADDRFTQGFFQATENRDDVPGHDGFRRRVYTTIVRMRNVGSRVEGT
jgi:prepilin-type N-terminal cleavage/methylation domain-containing protein